MKKVLGLIAILAACNASAPLPSVSVEPVAAEAISPAEESEPPQPQFSFVPRPGPEEMAKKQWENAASVDGVECRAVLSSAGYRFTSSSDVAAPDKAGCGIPHGVVVTRGPTGVTYSPPLVIDCSLALHLKEVERIVQEESDSLLGSSIVKIRNLGTYACRHRRGRWNDLMSEHAFGIAMDFSAFEPKKGRPVVVAKDYLLGQETDQPRALFLRRVYARLRAESGLSFVLGPEYNAQHRDHFHLDRGYRWWM